MLMSIFSSFDALSAEYVGREVIFSRGPSPSTSCNKQDASVATAKVDLNKGKEVKSSSQPTKDLRRTSGLRFAPEFDGVNCFETILPY